MGTPMSQMISLTRLARLVGIPRAKLQKMAQSGELETFDGQVELNEVLRAFPNARFEDDSEIHRVEEIKEAALSKPAAAADLPDLEVLERRLKKLSEEYAKLESQVSHYERVHGWLKDHIAELVSENKLPGRASSELIDWFIRELATPPISDERRRRLITRERLMRVMSAQVKVVPRGLSFETQGNETLLEAGLRAGLSFSYGCSNGNCGRCKARVISGQVVKVRPHDFRLSKAEKEAGQTLLCSYAAVGDIEIEAATAGADDIPEQTIATRVRAVEPLGENMLALHLLTPRSERLRFLAGQRVRVRLGDDELELPVASCPCEERRIELHVRRDARSAFSAHVEHDLRVNDTVILRGPFGDFVLDEASVRPIVLIAEGCGFPAIKSLVQHALSLDHAPDIAFYWLAGDMGHYQENLPRSYASALDNFHYVPLAGDLSLPQALAKITNGKSFAESEVYAAGRAEFLAHAKNAFLAAGLPPEYWHGEAISLAPSPQTAD
jgi:CDP-4-dehydro-6-deoxyglucose reductase